VNERGGVLVCSGDGDFSAWLRQGDSSNWREVSWRQGNYPALNVQDVEISPTDLAAHIQKNFVGWVARKMNLPGVLLDRSGEILPKEEYEDAT
jgi:hypothetical protein